MPRLTDEELAERHPGVVELLSYFEYAHLPDHLQDVSRPIGDLAHEMVAILPDGPELTAGLRKLLEGKDCLVRQALRTTITRERGPWVAPNARKGEIERISGADADAYLRGEVDRGAGPDDEPADDESGTPRTGDPHGTFGTNRGVVQR
jgi:hypothetical protein